MKKMKIISVIISLMLTMCFAVSYSSAATTIANPTAIFTDTNTPNAETLNPIVAQEVGNAGFGDGYFTIKIPADVKLAQTGSGPATAALGASAAELDALTRSEAVLGSSSAPKSLYVLGATDSGIVGWRSGASWLGIFKVYASSDSAVYSTSALGQRTNTVGVGNWVGVDTRVPMPTSAASSTKIGEIYLDSTNETVISLAGLDSNTGASEKLWLQDICVIPTTAKATGNINLSVLNGNVAGAGGIGITDDTSVKVMTMVDQAVNVAGTSASASVPVLKAGSVAAQDQGVITITKVGAITATTADKLTFTLDNGATFHNDAATAADSTWMTAAGGASNDYTTAVTGGQLVITSAAGEIPANGTLTLAALINTIDVSNVTVAGTITCTITGAGQFVTVNKSVAVATTALGGTTLSFVDDSTAGAGKRYAGRNGQAFPGATGEYILVGENAPGSLLQGGLFTMTLGSGAFFQTSTQVTIVDTTYTTSPYSNAALDIATDAATAKSATKTLSVTTPSSTTLGGFKITAATLDLRGATTGTLLMTVSGTAGATGSVTVCEIINATTSTIGTPITVVPGTTITLPDITITENAVGALSISGNIGLHFPTGVTLSTTATPTITTTPATSGSASTSTVTGSVASSDLMLDVITASTTTTGAYTIVISGLQATIASTVASGGMNLTLAGSTNTTYSAAAFGSNFGAMATLESLTFGTLVSSTVPFADTAVVSGTTVTQTFIPAGNDIGKVGDLYVFTLGTTPQYYAGSAWSATVTPYSAAGTLGSTSVVYDISAVAASTKIYIGYGTGVSGTESTMNTNGTFVLAYTTAAAPTIVPVVIPATAGAAVTATINTTDTYTLNLATTNAAGATPTAEYVVYQVIVSGTPSGWWFMTPTGSVQYVPGLDPTTVTYDTAAAGSISLGDFLLGTYLPTAGDQLILVYAYATGTVDFADPTSYVVENVVTMTVQ